MRLARRTVVAQACGLVLLAAGAGQAVLSPASGATAAVSARKATPVTASVKVATYNVAADLTVDEAVSDVTKLATSTGADVVALQEMGSAKRRAGVVAGLVDCSMCEYEAYVPQLAVPGSTPILYRWEKFRLVSTGTEQVSDATYVGAQGAGPSTLRAKYINYVELRERATGRTVYVLNNHAVPTVQGKGGGSNSNTARVDLYRQHMAGLKSMVAAFEAKGGSVLVTGDLNVNFRKDKVVRDRAFPYYNLHQVGLQASYEPLGEPTSGTHRLSAGNDTRLIDYVYFQPSAALKAVSQRVMLGYRSDHRPLVVEFALQGQ